MARKVCKKCKLFVEKESCPICKGTSFSENWKGRIFIANPNTSEVAKNLGIIVKGEYAIKVK